MPDVAATNSGRNRFKWSSGDAEVRKKGDPDQSLSLAEILGTIEEEPVSDQVLDNTLNTDEDDFAQKRHPAGSSKGGQFAPKDGGSGSGGGEAGEFVEDIPFGTPFRENREAIENAADYGHSTGSVQSIVFRKYSEENYKNVNDCMRKRKGCTEKLEKGNKIMEDFIDKNPIPVDTVVYRGVSSRSVKKMFGDNVRVGDVISDKGFASTSMNKDVASSFIRSKRGGGAMMVIRARKGTKAVSMRKVSKYSEEMEVLIQRGSRFKVIGVRRSEIHVEVIQ